MERVEACLICGTTENERPLVSQRYRGHSIWVCTGCMPIVIHHPEQVAHRLATLATSEPEREE